MLPDLASGYGSSAGQGRVRLLASWHRQIRAAIRRMRGWPVIRGADVPWNEKQGQSVNSKSQMRRGLQPACDFSHRVGLCWATQKSSTTVGHRLWRQEEPATQQVEVPREQQQKPSVIRFEKRAGQ